MSLGKTSKLINSLVNENILRATVNEKLENEIMFSNYRKVVFQIIDANIVKTSYIPLLDWLIIFDTPKVLTEFTDGQKSIIDDIKIELTTLAKQLGYNL